MRKAVTAALARSCIDRRLLVEVLGDAVGAASLLAMIFVLSFLGEMFR